ncbi:MAG TPA: hypothetical protein VJZ03_04725, partial [Candidatus Bathyarchaeia archaeon]|nr:hypothetical protein [Candidatus Bathyarchaeia archaeon]
MQRMRIRSGFPNKLRISSEWLGLQERSVACGFQKKVRRYSGWWARRDSNPRPAGFFVHLM